MIEPRHKRAIVRVEVRSGKKVIGWGTGFVVAPGKVLTAYHVVADRDATTFRPHPGQIWLCFPEHEVKAKKIDEKHCDQKLDFALLDAEIDASITPIRLRPLSTLDKTIEWHSFGFPTATDSTRKNGKVHAGKFRDANGQYDKAQAFELFCVDAAAGDGEPIQGLSGAPCMLGGYAVGLLRSALLDKRNKVIAGTLYACPIDRIVEKCEAIITLEKPLPFEPKVVELLAKYDSPTLREMASVLNSDNASSDLKDALRHLSDLEDAETLRRLVVREMLYQGPDGAARALEGIIGRATPQVIDSIVTMAGAAWIPEQASNAMSKLLEASPNSKPMAINAGELLTGEMYAISAIKRSWGLEIASIGTGTGASSSLQDELRQTLMRVLGCSSDKELDAELRRLEKGNHNEVFVVVHEPAHHEASLTALRGAFSQKKLHVLWLAGQGPFGALRRAMSNIELIEPEIDPQSENDAVDKLAVARRTTVRNFSRQTNRQRNFP